jgi:hypothetical protein
MFQDRADDGDVEWAERSRQLVNVAVENLGFRAEQSMAQPVGVFPTLDLSAVLFRPARPIAIIEFVFEWKKRLRRAIALVERNDARCAAFLGFETQEARRGSNIEDRFSGDVHAADVIVETPAQIPVGWNEPEARQFHGVIKKTVIEPLDEPRRREQRGAHD